MLKRKNEMMHFKITKQNVSNTQLLLGVHTFPDLFIQPHEELTSNGNNKPRTKATLCNSSKHNSSCQQLISCMEIKLLPTDHRCNCM